MKLQLPAALFAFTNLLFASNVSSQPWVYDFGTGTAMFDTSNKASTTFFSTYTSAPPTGGGTYRLRNANNTGTILQGSGSTLANPGTTLSTGTELQINAATSTGSNKFTVYQWSNPTTAAYLKAKIRTTSTGSGTLAINMGDATGNAYSLNDNYISYSTTLSSFAINYTGGTLSTVTRRDGVVSDTIANPRLQKDADQLIEVYASNGAGATTYIKNGTNNLNAQSWDLWVNGIKVSADSTSGWAKAKLTAGSSITAGTTLSGFGFYATNSTANEAFIYIDDIEYSNALPTALPLHFLSFKGALQEHNAVLQWITADEQNVSHYTIEKSRDGNTFSAISTVRALNRAYNPYSFTDTKTDNGTCLYRIKSTDVDGSMSYSPIVKLTFNSGSLTLYPNPVVSTAIVSHEAAGKAAVLKISNRGGQIVWQQNITVGSARTSVNIRNLPAGNYFMIFQNDDASSVSSFEKQ